MLKAVRCLIPGQT